MKLSPLQLKHYHYSHLQLESVNGDEFIGKDTTSPYWVPSASHIQTSITVGEPGNPRNTHSICFCHKPATELSRKKFPYKFIVALDGVFICTENEQLLESFKHELVVNATSMLYSTVREQLLTLSSRQKFGPLMLPSLDFRSLREAES